ncbi:hypothetical protein PR048_033599 [Dryococelus australis]|uniref:Uncharacterized protein n=1 Tax=Dryococelus australis TaxID=614101 RepID=A0ABQ9G0S0_9NEOP|nr:hypothetical protein PR048_033599 [Dryococelus australis]
MRKQGETGDPRENLPTSEHRPARFPRVKSRGRTRRESEPGSPRWEAIGLTTASPRPPLSQHVVHWLQDARSAQSDPESARVRVARESEHTFELRHGLIISCVAVSRGVYILVTARLVSWLNIRPRCQPGPISGAYVENRYKTARRPDLWAMCSLRSGEGKLPHPAERYNCCNRMGGIRALTRARAHPPALSFGNDERARSEADEKHDAGERRMETSIVTLELGYLEHYALKGTRVVRARRAILELELQRGIRNVGNNRDWTTESNKTLRQCCSTGLVISGDDITPNVGIGLDILSTYSSAPTANPWWWIQMCVRGRRSSNPREGWVQLTQHLAHILADLGQHSATSGTHLVAIIDSNDIQVHAPPCPEKTRTQDLSRLRWETQATSQRSTTVVRAMRFSRLDCRLARGDRKHILLSSSSLPSTSNCHPCSLELTHGDPGPPGDAGWSRVRCTLQASAGGDKDHTPNPDQRLQESYGVLGHSPNQRSENEFRRPNWGIGSADIISLDPTEYRTVKAVHDKPGCPYVCVWRREGRIEKDRQREKVIKRGREKYVREVFDGYARTGMSQMRFVTLQICIGETN